MPAISSTAVQSSIKRYITISILRIYVDTREGRKDYAEGMRVVLCDELHENGAVIGWCLSRELRGCR